MMANPVSLPLLVLAVVMALILSATLRPHRGLPGSVRHRRQWWVEGVGVMPERASASTRASTTNRGRCSFAEGYVLKPLPEPLLTAFGKQKKQGRLRLERGFV